MGKYQKRLTEVQAGDRAELSEEQWTELNAYLQDGRIELSNNRAERSIKPFVISRKDFLFANTPGGARCSAILFSLIETAKENRTAISPGSLPKPPSGLRQDLPPGQKNLPLRAPRHNAALSQITDPVPSWGLPPAGHISMLVLRLRRSRRP